MVDTLRCDEVLSPARHSTPIVNVLYDRNVTAAATYHDLLPHFCHAYRDRAILDDQRVFQNLLELETCYMAKLDHYKILQDEIKIHMRKIVTEWMLDVCVDQRCNVDVFLLAANIMDRFLETIKLQKNQFQLLGAASIFLASKMIEPSPISATTLIRCTADTYDREDLLKMELLILSKLKWDLTAVTSYDYLDYLLDALLNPNKNRKSSSSNFRHPVMLTTTSADDIRRTTEKLITLCATDSDFMELPPSLVSSASLLVAIRKDQGTSLQPGVNLNQVIARLQAITPLDMETLRENVEKIERVFLGNSNPSQLDDNLETSGYASSSMNISTNEDEENDGAVTGLAEPAETEDQLSSILKVIQDEKVKAESVKEKEKKRESDNATPTEVFNVSASCVT